MLNNIENMVPTIDPNPILPIPINRFSPTGKLVVCYAYRPKTEAGLVLPKGASNPEQSPLALVLAVGPECTQVKAGDTIIMGHEMSKVSLLFHQKVRYWVMPESNITGVVLPEFVPDDSDVSREEAKA